MNSKKHLVILITLLLLTVSACAAKSTKGGGFKNEGYSSHPGGQGHPWDKGRSF